MQKLLARAGVASRRRAEELILAGRVSVDGQVVAQLGAKADPDRSLIEVDGRPVTRPRLIYLMLNKPSGYICTASDPQRRPTALDLAPRIPGLHSVGRLDASTEGLLLLTNDGEFTQRITHPSHLIEKAYRATVPGRPSQQSLRRLKEGVELEDGRTAPARVRLLRAGQRSSLLEMVIHEGRQRQVRRMLEAVGHPVSRLRRVRVNGISLGDLPLGKWRHLTWAELEQFGRQPRPDTVT